MQLGVAGTCDLLLGCQALGDSGEHGTPSPALSEPPVWGRQEMKQFHHGRDQCCPGDMGAIGYQEVREASWRK